MSAAPMQARRFPIDPSQVLLGEIEGASLCLPKALPTKMAAVSPHQMGIAAVSRRGQFPGDFVEASKARGITVAIVHKIEPMLAKEFFLAKSQIMIMADTVAIRR